MDVGIDQSHEQLDDLASVLQFTCLIAIYYPQKDTTLFTDYLYIMSRRRNKQQGAWKSFRHNDHSTTV